VKIVTASSWNMCRGLLVDAFTGEKRLKIPNMLKDACIGSLTGLLVSFFRSLVMIILNLRSCVLIVL
jgi:hypothetical protein